ncbi:MAG: hypothetical protein K2O33_04410, partial [Muribaculaceae bacterium]|nr:hypothetical protein [Muribaculaceae bacterium]
QTYYGSSIYDYSTGKFEILPSYAGSSDSELIEYGLEWGAYNADANTYTEMWYDYIQLSGKFYNYDADIDAEAGYFYRNAGETNGHFKASFAINDNAVGVVKIVNKKIATSEELNAEFSAMLNNINAPTADMAVLTAAQGWFDLTVAPYADGDYSLVFGWSDGVEDANGNLSFNGASYSLMLDGAEFVLDGFAKYNDAFMPGFLALFGATTQGVGFPSTYSTTCQVEKSETEAGSYRLRAPYAEYPLGGLLDYWQDFDYLYYNVADPNKAIVEPSMLGVVNQARLEQNGSLKYLMMGAASTSVASGLEIDNGFGVYADNRLTMPGTNYTTTIEGAEKKLGPLSVVMWNLSDTGAMYLVVDNPQDFLIETGAVDAIENVEASTDTNAPVEYFNLQGQKVITPAAGQLVIKKQGGKATKMSAQ